MFNQISSFFLRAVNELLAFFYALPVIGGSYGGAIIMLTLVVMIALMPLTLRATKSQIKMMQMQPKLRALQREYKDDKVALNQEMMALYQAEGINPIGGCLPMLAQAPVLLVLFRVLRGLVRREWERPYFVVATKAQEMAGFSPTVGDTFDPANLSHNTQLYHDLSHDTSLDFLGGIVDLGRSASDVMSESVVHAIPYLLMIGIVIATSFYQQKQIQARRSDDDQQMTPQQRTQQQLLKILPLMSGVWSFAFPAGVVLYWMTSNLFRIGQQAYITRSLYSEDGIGTQAMKTQAEMKAADAEEKKNGKATKSGDTTGAGGKKSGDKKSGDKSKKKNNSDNGTGDESVAALADDNANGGGSGGSNKAGSRSAEWQRMRQARAQAKSRSNAPVEGSSRVTPKGTKPQSKNKKRR